MPISVLLLNHRSSGRLSTTCLPISGHEIGLESSKVILSSSELDLRFRMCQQFVFQPCVSSNSPKEASFGLKHSRNSQGGRCLNLFVVNVQLVLPFPSATIPPSTYNAIPFARFLFLITSFHCLRGSPKVDAWTLERALTLAL